MSKGDELQPPKDVTQVDLIEFLHASFLKQKKIETEGEKINFFFKLCSTITNYF